MRKNSINATIGMMMIFCNILSAENIRSLEFAPKGGIAVTGFTGEGGASVQCPAPVPLFSFELNDSLVLFSNNAKVMQEKDSVNFIFNEGITGSYRIVKDAKRGVQIAVTFRNGTKKKQQISGLVPLGEAAANVFIKAAGPSDYQRRLSRSQLFLPGRGAIGVVLPDNAWEMGFCDVQLSAEKSIAAIARRGDSFKADARRFRTVLEEGGSVQYTLYIDDHSGNWRDGLDLMFRKRWLYDLESFDNSLFERKDLEWIRKSYLMILQFAWDHEYYEAKEGKYNYYSFLKKNDPLVGGFEAYMIWPTWPRLGLDPRNQWDMYRDLPGGLAELRKQSEFAQKNGTKYFIAYNPWDGSTRKEDHLKGMEDVLRDINADGVVLDTWGESNKEFQAAVDRVKPGIILYSEGMAVPKDMPTIVAGRVHDAIYLPPPLNLNKLIKPEFAIFRVAQLAEGRIHRETAIAFFNGYGTEMNIMRPGRPDWIEEEFRYLGLTTKILRENSEAFIDKNWVPLLPTLVDSIWVNQWQAEEKTVYTVLSLRPEGWSAPLFQVPSEPGYHYVSLWNHEELTLQNKGDKYFVPVTVDGFSRSWLGTRREGNIDCIVRFPELLTAELVLDSIRFSASRGTKVVITGGTPSYAAKYSAEFKPGNRTVSIIEHLGRHEEKFVVQLFDGDQLLDEKVLNLPLATPRMISKFERTAPALKTPEKMAEIPAGLFHFKSKRSFLSPNETIPYPGDSSSRIIPVQKFFMDIFPVTNADYQKFLKSSNYKPADGANFLKHWIDGAPPKGMENHPVIYVDIEDARAFARWAGKRLPTDIEWQYAAQGTDGRKYPWGNKFDSTKCNSGIGKTTPVDFFPNGKSPFGVADMIGNVWQWTNDVYDNVTYYFGMLRGGSYYNPTSSWWYIPGGPQPADNPQIQLLVSPGFDRNATVGFRCVKDAP